VAAVSVIEGPFQLPQQPTVAKYFKVLSDPARVRVLGLLHERGEMSVGELT